MLWKSRSKPLRMKSEDGGSAAEFVIVLPVLMLLLFGIIELGMVMYDQAVITNASREGARFAILWTDPPPTVDAVKQVARDYAEGHLMSFGSATPNVNVAQEANAAGRLHRVTVQYQYDFLVLPRLVTQIAGPLILSATTAMRDEDQE